MGNPEVKDAATQGEEISLEQQLNTVVKGMEFDEVTNTYKLPDDIPENLKLAALAEKRRRDTQASLTKSRQELKKLESANKQLQERVLNNVNIAIPEDQLAELEDLKYSDPEAWRKKMNDIEREAKQKTKDSISETFSEADKAAEVERRQLVLQEFLTLNPGLQINDDIITNDIPPRITKRLDSGEISFEDFLEESKNYLKKSGYVVQDTEKTPTAPNLGKVGGRTSVSKRVVEEDIISSYKNEVY